MNYLIIEQGTLLDRIDYNIESALDSTKKAKKELVKADQSSKSSRGNFCIKMLVFWIIGFTIILFLKYYMRTWKYL